MIDLMQKLRDAITHGSATPASSYEQPAASTLTAQDLYDAVSRIREDEHAAIVAANERVEAFRASVPRQLHDDDDYLFLMHYVAAGEPMHPQIHRERTERLRRKVQLLEGVA